MHLEISHLYKQFPTQSGPLVALKDINLQVETGELVCVVGASGSGKSTLLRLVAGLDQPTAGTIAVDSQPVTGPGADRGMVFQRYTLYPWMTVQKNVEFGLKLQGVKLPKRRETASYYLDVVGLTQFAQALPKELSGGMKQRVAIARVLASQPKILLLDEPVGALDVQTKERMQQFLLELWERTGISILMITHDVEEAVFLAQRIYVLTAHPGTVQRELKIDLPRDRNYHVRRQPRVGRDGCVGTVPSHSASGAQCHAHVSGSRGRSGSAVLPLAQRRANHGSSSASTHGNSRATTADAKPVGGSKDVPNAPAASAVWISISSHAIAAKPDGSAAPIGWKPRAVAGLASTTAATTSA